MRVRPHINVRATLGCAAAGLADYKGCCVMLFFGVTQCPDVFRADLARAADVMQRLGTQASRLRLIFVTVDPERDSPAVLREYPRAFHPSFIGLLADPPATEATAKAFKVFYRKLPTGSSYTMNHTAAGVVFDPTGRMRLTMRHEQDAASVTGEITRLLTENP
jgi:protein SCO1/2